MTFARPSFDFVLMVGFVAICLIMTFMWWRLAEPKRRWLFSLMVMIILLCAIAIDVSGLSVQLDLQPPAFTVVTGLAIVGLSFFCVKLKVFKPLSTRQLIQLQVFRLPLELLMWHASNLGVMPKTFSFEGYNHDVLIGLAALGLAVWLQRAGLHEPQGPWLIRAVKAFNYGGMASLCMIALLAALTSPNLAFFGHSPEQINSWVLYFPYALLPMLLVVYAVMGHVLLGIKLRQQEPRLNASSHTA